MALAIRDPEDFYDSASPSSDPSTSSSSSSTRQKRLPSLEELRLFTAGSDSGDLIERCLFTGAILVSFRVVSAARTATNVSIGSFAINPSTANNPFHVSKPLLSHLDPSGPYPFRPPTLISPSQPPHPISTFSPSPPLPLNSTSPL
jgi:hypothetical protein